MRRYLLEILVFGVVAAGFAAAPQIGLHPLLYAASIITSLIPFWLLTYLKPKANPAIGLVPGAFGAKLGGIFYCYFVVLNPSLWTPTLIRLFPDENRSAWKTAAYISGQGTWAIMSFIVFGVLGLFLCWHRKSR